MSSKHLRFIAITLVVLLLLWGGSELLSRGSDSVTGALALPALSQTDVDTIAVIKGTDSIVLARQSPTAWSANGHRAALDAVGEVFQALADTARPELVAQEPASFARLGVDSAAGRWLRLSRGGVRDAQGRGLHQSAPRRPPAHRARRPGRAAVARVRFRGNGIPRAPSRGRGRRGIDRVPHELLGCRRNHAGQSIAATRQEVTPWLRAVCRLFCRASMADLSLSRSQLLLLAGTANRPLAEEMAAHLGQPLCAVTIRRFADGEIFVKIDENVRGRDVFIIQP